MRVDLWELAKKDEKEHVVLTILDRLPPNLEEPCTVSVEFAAKAVDDYYLLSTTTRAELNIFCERCAKSFLFPYENTLELAVCDNDTRAEALSYQYESLVSERGCINMEELITDELHLYAPRTHASLEDCDKEIETYLVKDQESK